MREEEIRERLRAEAEKAIDKLLQTKRPDDELTFSEIEDLAGEVGKQVEQAALRELVQVEDRAQGGMKCPECGQTAQNKGLKKRQIVSRRGTVEVERRYYYCGHCQQGFFPPR